MTFKILNERMRREPSGHTRKEWLCECACGHTAWRHAQHVKTGRSTQCKSCAAKTHGNSEKAEYKIWYAMWHRCTNPKNKYYNRYGGRGITVAKRWATFASFYADMGPCPQGFTLERVNNNRGYSKSNCVWATQAEQNANRSNAVLLTAFGKTQHLAAWAREVQIRYDTLAYRLKKGWPIEKALTKEVAHV